LPDRDLGQYAVDEMSSGFGHAPATAGRTESSSSRREGNEPVVAEGVAVDAEEFVVDDAALEIAAELAFDEASHGRPRRSRACQ
jgi:hypothetical protein